MNTLIIIATYNELENLPLLVQKIRQCRPSDDILVVDDNSPDGTGQLADQLAASDRSLHVLHRVAKEGLSKALQAGFDWALKRSYEFVVNIDGDLSHDPADISAMICACGQADLVIGSRYYQGIRVHNWPPRRLLLSMMAAKYVRCVTRLPVQDPTSGFRCFRGVALQSLLSDRPLSTGYSIHIEMAFRTWAAGMQVSEIPIVFTDRRIGVTKLNSRIIIEALSIPWRLVALQLYGSFKGHRRQRRATLAAANHHSRHDPLE